MILNVQEIPQGRSPVRFTLDVETVGSYLRDVDPVYGEASEPATVELEVDRFKDNLDIRGTVTLGYRFSCARCAEPLSDARTVSVHWTLLPHAALGASRLSDEEEVELSADDLEVSFYEGQEIDLAALVREALILELDDTPSCGDEGCPHLQRSLAVLQAMTTDDDIDPRWAQLAALKGQLKKN